MPKVCEIVAVVKDRKSAGQKAITALYQQLQKSSLFEGRSRVYTPTREGETDLPRETTVVQTSFSQSVQAAWSDIVAMLDVVRSQDQSNCASFADVTVDGMLILENVPATHLLFLEKFLGDMITALSAAPLLDPSTKWVKDENTGLFKSVTESESVRTRKEPQVLVKSEATEHHPAQTEVYHVDVPIGVWKETRFSGALNQADQVALVRKTIDLREAVRSARERANSSEATLVKQGENIMQYIFGS